MKRREMKAESLLMVTDKSCDVGLVCGMFFRGRSAKIKYLTGRYSN
jgi:hypothetical protein